MKTPQRYTVPFRRKRQGLTNYRKRRLMLLSRLPRLVIRKSLAHIWLQVVTYHENGDSIVASSHSKELKTMGWPFKANNLPASYLVGMLLAKHCQKKNVKTLVLDLGLQSSVGGSRLFAALKGVIDGGVHVSCSPEVLPSQERILGKHIAEYVKNVPSKSLQFNSYRKSGAPIATIGAVFEQMKSKITSHH